MTSRTDELMTTLREQLQSIKRELDAEREQREKVQQELSDYKAYMEEPIYENEESPVQGDDRALTTIPEDRPALPLLPRGLTQHNDDFQFSPGVNVSGVVGQGSSVQNRSSPSHVSEISAAGFSGNPVPVSSTGMQGQGSQLPGGGNMPPLPPFPGSAGAGGYGGPMQGPVFHVMMTPKEPPVFCGKTSEDVETWIYTVSAYFRTVAAPEEQKVGYALTFLQDTAREWWINTIRTTGREPQTWTELATALRERF